METLINVFTNPLYWLIAGIFLMVAEFMIPGGIVFFLGLGSTIVAAGLWLHLIDTWMQAFTVFFISSLASIIMLRAVFTRFAEGASSRANTNELLDDLDEIVEVIVAIGPAEQEGIVRYRGTSWKAVSDGSAIEAGEKARIVSRENITLVVKKVDLATVESFLE